MGRLLVIAPSTFFCSEPVCIKDNNNNIFYVHPNKEGKINFNLPKGLYFTNNRLDKKQFQPYAKFDYPVFKQTIKDINIEIKKNPNKATIIPTLKKIIIDKKLSENKYKPALVFLLVHEIGHLKYGGDKFENGVKVFDAEKACDSLAVNYMLSHGYNPTQISIAKEIILSGQDRKNCIHNETIKQNFRR